MTCGRYNFLTNFITQNGNNQPFLLFLNMVGHYFDNIWIYLQSITDINLANNNLEQGVSKDLVYHVLQSLGTKLYNKYGDSSNDTFLIGQNSGPLLLKDLGKDNSIRVISSKTNNIIINYEGYIKSQNFKDAFDTPVSDANLELILDGFG